MTGHPYTEDRLVEQPAIALFAELGWQTVSAMDEVFGPSGTRADYLEKFQQLIDDYNAGSRNIEEKLTIEDALDEDLPRSYSKDVYQSKCAALFEHVYESYLGDGASVYRDAA